MTKVDVEHAVAVARLADGSRKLQKAIDLARDAADCFDILSEVQIERAINVLQLVLRLRRTRVVAKPTSSPIMVEDAGG